MFHLKPLIIGTVGLGVAMLTILPLKENKAPICYDCSIEIIKRNNDSLRMVNNMLYSQVKDTLEIGKKAMQELDVLRYRIKYYKQDVDTITIIKEIHDSVYLTKESTKEYLITEKY